MKTGQEDVILNQHRSNFDFSEPLNLQKDLCSIGKYATHSLRWQQKSNSEQTDIYGVDQRSFAIQVAKNF